MARFEEVIERLRQYEDDDGDLATLIDQAEEAWKASPVRRDKEAAEKRANELAEKLAKRDEFVWKTTFKDIGVKANPAHLKLPEDLDPLDTQQVTAWATEAGFLEKQPDTPAAEQEQHQRVEAAVTGAAPSGPTMTKQAEILQALDPTKLTEEEFWAKADELKVTLQTQR